MPRRLERAQPQHSNGTVLLPLQEQRDGTAGEEPGTSVPRTPLEDDTSSFPESSEDRIQRLEAELVRARREADEGSMELQHLRAEVAQLTTGSPALPSNLAEFGFILPRDCPNAPQRRL